MGRPRSRPLAEYEAAHARYLRTRERLLALAKVRYQEDREERLAAMKRGRDAARAMRQRQKAIHDVEHSERIYLGMTCVERARLYVDQQKAGPCLDCGQTFPPWVMDFDHVRGEKRTHVSELTKHGKSIRILAAEIAKCDLVCANCHRTRTYIRAHPQPRLLKK